MELDKSRIALLSLSDDGDPLDANGTGNSRIVAGVSALERQIDIALALGCGRIWLHAPVQSALAIAAQHLAEKNGAQFRLLAHGRQLLGGVRRQDALIVLAEGLVLSSRDGLALLEGGPNLLRLPFEEGLKAGFERLDRDYAWAGAMVLPGQIVERLEELPQDIDPVSALVRAARSARLPESDLPRGWIADGTWSLTGDVPSSQERSEKRTLVERSARLLREKTVAGMFVGALALASLVASIAATVYARPGIALMLVALAIVCLRVWFACRAMRDPLVFSGRVPSILPFLAYRAPDAIGVTALAMGLGMEMPILAASYVAFLTYAVWILAARLNDAVRALADNHEVLWLVLGISGALGLWFAAAACVTLLALIFIGSGLRAGPAITRA